MYVLFNILSLGVNIYSYLEIGRMAYAMYGAMDDIHI